MKHQTLVSLSGNPIYNYVDGPNEFQTAAPKIHREIIINHIENYLGAITRVFYEKISDTIQIDIHLVPADKQQPYNILITSGMSDLAMHLPENIHAPRYLELMTILPDTWKISQHDFAHEKWFWPIRQLLFLARFPHKFDSWLGWGHTIPNNEPPEAFAENTKLCAIMLLASAHTNPNFHNLKIDAEKTIQFLSICPLYQEEMHFKLRNGPNKLLEKFAHQGISDLINPGRINCITNK